MTAPTSITVQVERPGESRYLADPCRTCEIATYRTPPSGSHCRYCHTNHDESLALRSTPFGPIPWCGCA